MIKLTGRDNKEFVLNAEQIEKLDEVDGTLITLINGKKYLVIEDCEEIVEKIINYKKSIYLFPKDSNKDK